MAQNDSFGPIKSTYQLDFKVPRLPYLVKAKWPKNSSEIPIPPPKAAIPVQFDTLQAGIAGKRVPFDLYFNLDPITHRDEACRSAADLLKASNVSLGDPKRVQRAKKTIQPPAVSMDDAVDLLGGDVATQELLRLFTYTTSWGKAAAEAAMPNKPAPSVGLTPQERADQMRHEQIFTQLPRGWSKLARDWDKLQLRCVDDQNAAFWREESEKIRCPCLDARQHYYTPELVQELAGLVKNDRLHLAYQIPMISYAGFKPRNVTGIPSQKRELSITDSWTPVTNAFSMRTVSKSGC